MQALRSLLVHMHADLVPAVLHSIPHTLRDHRDLLQEGMVGLVRAAASFDPRLGRFPTYARMRIRGAILDAMRAPCFGGVLDVSRTLQRRRKEAGLPMRPQAEPIFENVPDPRPDVERATLARDEVDALLARLPQVERDVIRASFGLENVAPATGARIGLALGVSESRVAQIRARALERLRAAACA